MSYQIERLGQLFHDASRAMRRRFAGLTVAHGLSATQWRLLGRVLREGPATQAALADYLDVEPISVSRLIDRMESSGWVRRESHPEDRRAKIIVATDQARAAAPSVRAIAFECAAEALTGLTDDERRAFHAALLTIIETLNRASPDRPENAAGATNTHTLK